MALRLVLAASLGAVRVEGGERIARQADPAIFALTHHGFFEALLAPTALLALRAGRPLRFLVDWMFLELPLAGHLLRLGDPIPVYAKPARWRWRERRRRTGLAGPSPVDRALTALASGASVGLYPEGRRNRDPHLLLPPRRGVGLLALRSGAPVLPIGLDFPARDRLRRTPRVGRLVLRPGEPIDTSAEHREWLAAGRRSTKQVVAAERALGTAIADRVALELARLSRKVHLPKEATLMATTPILVDSRTAPLSPAAHAPATPAAPAAPASLEIRVRRLADPETRRDALVLLEEVYRSEKGWVDQVDTEIPEPGDRSQLRSWLVAYVGADPAGAVRLTYDPPLELPREAEVELDPAIDLDRLRRSGRFVEVGRLAIAARHRKRTGVVLALMRATIAEVVERGYTHLITAVFEDDPHSPYSFHTRVLGFERIGTHRRGELRCPSRRILLTLDIARAYARLEASRGRILERLAGGREERFERLRESTAV